MGLLAGFKAWSGLRAYKALPAAKRAITFYTEDAGSLPHLEPILDALLASGQEVAWLTSSLDDPTLQRSEPGLAAFWIGDGAMRTTAFMTLDCQVLVMTMPDLETFHIKRSRTAQVHYVYVFHSVVSTHMIYRPAAFDHFDTVLTVGPHHDAEIRAREAAAGLVQKRLVPHGYARLERIVAEAPALAPGDHRARPIRVLIAPSWGPTGVLETCGEPLVQTLLDAGMEVIVRPHPATTKHTPAVVGGIVARFGGHERFALDQDMRSRSSLLTSDVMISDWSGAALEYAFGLNKPVLFLDVPRKVNNPAWEQLGIEPMEAAVRTQIGRVHPADALATLPDALAALCQDPERSRAAIAAARDRHMHHQEGSATVAAAAIQAIRDEHIPPVHGGRS